MDYVQDNYRSMKTVPELQPCKIYRERGQRISSMQAGSAVPTYSGVVVSGGKKEMMRIMREIYNFILSCLQRLLTF